MLELISVTKTFGKTVAVDNLSLQCREQEFLVIFGPAGAGKTTTLRMIAGIMEPDRGEVRFQGKSLRGVPPEQRNMSMVFENYALYSHMTVFDNLAFPLRARKLAEDQVRQRVQQMAETIHIGDLLERRPGFLSGGQRQRVALGRGLIREADVYLLDEPIAHLDARLRHQMRAELKALCAEKEATVVHVTHDHREAMALSDRMVVINKGHPEQIASPEDVYYRPASEFVAGFVGDPPMSLLDVEYVEERGKPGFRVPERDVWLPANGEIAKQLEGRSPGGTMRLGFRATEVNLQRAGDGGHAVPGEVYVVEGHGRRNLLTVKVGKALLQVATPADETWNVRDTVWMRLDSDNLHLFVDGIGLYHPAVKVTSDPRS